MGTNSPARPYTDMLRALVKANLAMLFAISLIVLWGVVSMVADIPEYKLPNPQSVIERGWQLIQDGTLFENIWISMYRLVLYSGIGAVLALPLGVGIALNRYLASFFMPLVIFFQSIAGIAWVPLAIIWFGFGTGTVGFVIANGVFFIVLFNTITGISQIPQNLKHMVYVLGGNQWDVLWQVVLPGALVNILGGLRFGLSFGWRALVAAEMISATHGLGYMTLDAAQYFQTETILVGIFTIGIIWLLMDRLILQEIERRTVARWGLVHEHDL